jgi:hypothetical protein
LVTFKSYTEAILSKPIQSIYPQIPITGEIMSSSFILTILHENHGLFVGDIIKFSGMISTFGISENNLNGNHVIKSVPTNNTYTIELNDINLNNTRTDTGGGYGVKAYTPNKFRLLFNYPNTMGSRLGFRNVGHHNSITKYNTIIMNSDEYQNEIVKIEDDIKYFYDDSGNCHPLTNNALNLDGCDYILMHIEEFSNGKNISCAKNIETFFAKINLSRKYNHHSQLSVTLSEPIELSELTVSFYDSDGTLFDFYGAEHSYVIQITYIEYLPEETGTASTHTVN